MLMERVEILRLFWGATRVKAGDHVQLGNKIPRGLDRLSWEAELAASQEIIFHLDTGETRVQVEDIQNDRSFDGLRHLGAKDFYFHRRRKDTRSRVSEQLDKRVKISLEGLHAAERQIIEKAEAEIQLLREAALAHLADETEGLRKEFASVARGEYVLPKFYTSKLELR